MPYITYSASKKCHCSMTRGDKEVITPNHNSRGQSSGDNEWRQSKGTTRIILLKNH